MSQFSILWCMKISTKSLIAKYESSKFRKKKKYFFVLAELILMESCESWPSNSIRKCKIVVSPPFHLVTQTTNVTGPTTHPRIKKSHPSQPQIQRHLEPCNPWFFQSATHDMRGLGCPPSLFSCSWFQLPPPFFPHNPQFPLPSPYKGIPVISENPKP